MSPFTYSKLFLAVLASFTVLVIKNAVAQNTISRIVGGTATTVDTNQYLVSLLTNKGTNFVCGGGLIQPQQVVTAAHCIIGYLPRNLTVRGGSSFYNQGGVLRQVIRIARPGIYNPVTLDMDVAALKLRLPMTGPNITVIPLCTRTLFVGNISKVTGWGQVSETNLTLPTQMRTVNLPIISNQVCSNRYVGFQNTNITANMFCANNYQVRGTCGGDSGSPLVVNGQLCGVTSFGAKCNEGYPNVFTRVNSQLVRGFITRQTNYTV